MSDTSPSSSLGSQGQTPRSRIPVASYRLRSPATPDSNGRAASPAATVYPRRQSSGSSSTTAIHASASQHSISHYSRSSPTTSFISSSTRCSSPSTIHQRATSPRSPQSNEAVKSPSASLERRSIDAVKSLTCGGSSTGHGGARAASIGSFASIREKRISGPVFQDASVVGLEPADPAAEDPHAHTHSPLPWQRQRLLSTAHEVEDEGSGAEPSPCTPTDGRSLADGGLKSRFSQSPGPDRSLKGAPSKTAITPGFGVAARLRKSLGVGDRSRSNSPLPPSRSQSPALSNKPPKARKVLGGLNLKRVETNSDDAVLTGTTAAAAATHSWDGSNYSRHSQQTFKSSHSGGGDGGWREKERERERAGSRASSFKRAFHKTSKSIKERLGSKTPQPDGGQEESPPPIPTRKPGLYADVLERLSYDQGRNSIAPYRAPLGNIADPLPPPLASTSPERVARTKKGSLPTQRRPLLLGKARRSRTVSVTASAEHSAPLVPATIRDSWIDMADDVRRQGGQVAVNGKARSAKKSEGGAGWYATWKKKSRRGRRRAVEEEEQNSPLGHDDLPPSALHVKPYVIAPERPPTLPSLRPAAPSPIESDFRFSTLWDSAKSAAPRSNSPAPAPAPAPTAPTTSTSPSAPQRALLLPSLNGLDESPRRIKALPQRSRGAPPTGGLPPLPNLQQQQHQRSHAASAFKSPPPAPALPAVTEASPPSVAPTPTTATSPTALFTPSSNASLFAPRTGTDSLPVPPPRPRNPHATRVSKGSASSSLSGVNIDPSTSVGASAAKTSARSATTVGSSILFSSCDVELALGRLLDEAIAKQRRERREAQRQSKAQERAQSSSAEKRREREKALGDLTRRATGKTREGQSGWSDDESDREEQAGQSDAAPGETIDQQLVKALARYLRLSRSPRSVRSTTHRDGDEEAPLDVSNADVAAVTATLQRLVSQYRSTPLSTPSHRRSHRSATRTTGHTHSVTSPLSSGRYLRTPERRRVAAAPGSGSSLFSSAYYSRQSSAASVVLTPEKWRRGEEKRHERRRERERGSSKRSSIAHPSAHAGPSSSTTSAPAPASHKSGSMTHSLDTHSVLSYTSTRLSATSSSGAGEDITSLLETMMESDVVASRVGVSPLASPSRKRKESGVDVTVAAMQIQQQRHWPPALESNTTSPSLPAVSLTPLQESTLVFGNPRSSFGPIDSQPDHHQQQQAIERNGSTPLKSILRFYEQAQPDWRENAPAGLAPTAMLADSQGSPCSKRRVLRASSSHNVNANINVAHAAQPFSGHSQQAPPASLPAYDGSPRRLPSAAAAAPAAPSSASKRSSKVVRRPRPGMPAAAPQGSPRVTRAVAAARAAAAAEAAAKAQAETERQRQHESRSSGVAVHHALLPNESLFSGAFAPDAIKRTMPNLGGKELSSPLQLHQHHHPQTPESELPLTPPWTGGRRQGQPRLGAISDPGTMPPLPTNTMAGGQAEERGRGHAFLSPPAVVITDADVEAKFRALSVTPAVAEGQGKVGVASSSTVGSQAFEEVEVKQERAGATDRRRRKVKRGEQSTASSTGSSSTSSPSPPPPGSGGQQGVLQQAGSPFR